MSDVYESFAPCVDVVHVVSFFRGTVFTGPEVERVFDTTMWDFYHSDKFDGKYPEFFVGVYYRPTGGEAQHLRDFDDYEGALKFARALVDGTDIRLHDQALRLDRALAKRVTCPNCQTKFTPPPAGG